MEMQAKQVLTIPEVQTPSEQGLFMAFLFLRLFFYFIYTCICLHIYVCEYPKSEEEGVRFPRASVTGGCEPSNMVARNQTLSLLTNEQFIQPSSHLSHLFSEPEQCYLKKKKKLLITKEGHLLN